MIPTLTDSCATAPRSFDLSGNETDFATSPRPRAEPGCSLGTKPPRPAVSCRPSGPFQAGSGQRDPTATIHGLDRLHKQGEVDNGLEPALLTRHIRATQSRRDFNRCPPASSWGNWRRIWRRPNAERAPGRDADGGANRAPRLVSRQTTALALPGRPATKPHHASGTPRSERSWHRSRCGTSPRRGRAGHRHLEYGHRQIPDHSPLACRGNGGRCAGREKHFAQTSVTFGRTETPVGGLATTTAPGPITWMQRDRLPRPTTATAEMRSRSTGHCHHHAAQFVAGPAGSVRVPSASMRIGANAKVVLMATTVRRIRTT
jgi:hypothetical protein